MEDGPTTGPMNVWPGEYVSDVRAEAIARTRGRPGWRGRTRSSRATMMHAAPSSAGQHIMAVSGSATTREASTSSAVTTWSDCRWANGDTEPEFQFLAAMAGK